MMTNAEEIRFCIVHGPQLHRERVDLFDERHWVCEECMKELAQAFNQNLKHLDEWGILNGNTEVDHGERTTDGRRVRLPGEEG